MLNTFAITILWASCHAVFCCPYVSPVLAIWCTRSLSSCHTDSVIGCRPWPICESATTSFLFILDDASRATYIELLLGVHWKEPIFCERHHSGRDRCSTQRSNYWCIVSHWTTNLMPELTFRPNTSSLEKTWYLECEACSNDLVRSGCCCSAWCIDRDFKWLRHHLVGFYVTVSNRVSTAFCYF